MRIVSLSRLVSLSLVLRRRSIPEHGLIGAAWLACALSLSPPAGAASWRATLIESPSGYAAKALNDRGQVVMNGGNRSVLYQHGALQDLGLFPKGDWTFGNAINNAGTVVGAAELEFIQDDRIDYSIVTSFRYGDGGLQSVYGRNAYGINNHGLIVGQAGAYQAFVYDSNSGSHTILAEGDASTQANAVNDAGQVVGAQGDRWATRDVTHGFVYSDGAMTKLDTLDRNNSSALDINHAGLVLGAVWNALDEYDTRTDVGAFLYADGEMKEIPTLNGYDSYAAALNDNGLVVGSFVYALHPDVYGGIRHAYLYDHRANRIVDLNDGLALGDGIFLSEAIDINNGNTVLARDNLGRNYLLAPVPEPETYALLFGGLGVMGMLARRRKTARS